MSAPLPVFEPDPVRRFRIVHEAMAGLKESGQAVGAHGGQRVQLGVLQRALEEQRVFEEGFDQLFLRRRKVLFEELAA